MKDGYVSSPGSARPPLAGASSLGPVAGDEVIEVTVALRPDPAQVPPDPGTILSREELAIRRGASADDVDAVVAFASSFGLDVVETDAAQRRVVLSGPASAIGEAFDVSLESFDHPDGAYRGHTGPIGLPGPLAPMVVAVLGLDNRNQATTGFRPAAQAGTSYTPVQVAAAYGYPTNVNGAGVTIGFIELGGGYSQSDLSTYFSGLGLPAPPVVAVSVDSATNAPTGTANGPDGEVMLDLEVAGAVANGAHLVVYFAPNTDQGFVDAVLAAAHDSTYKPSVLSISWGGPETTFIASTRQAFENALTDCSLAGVTVCAAAGDNGSSDSPSGGPPAVDYPASSPQVLGCGGTSLQIGHGTISSEVVWNDGPSGGATGGGVSASFPLPSWQQSAGVPGGTGRGVPDVAGNADPATGYQVLVDGSTSVYGGTSAVAPLWAALVALAVQTAGRPLGFVNPALYRSAGAFHDIVTGDNGAFHAGPGWDACTGLGSPMAAAVISALTSS